MQEANAERSTFNAQRRMQNITLTHDVLSLIGKT